MLNLWFFQTCFRTGVIYASVRYVYIWAKYFINQQPTPILLAKKTNILNIHTLAPLILNWPMIIITITLDVSIPFYNAVSHTYKLSLSLKLKTLSPTAIVLCLSININRTRRPCRLHDKVSYDSLLKANKCQPKNICPFAHLHSKVSSATRLYFRKWYSPIPMNNFHMLTRTSLLDIHI